MNILEELNHDLKKNWTIEEKIRYIYLKTCFLFSYDERYLFYKQINDEENLKRIKNKHIDLTNLQEENRVICTTYAKEIISKLITELLNIKVELHGNSHNYIIINNSPQRIKADATISSDLARVKINLNTKGYREIHTSSNFEAKLKEMDKNIQYISKEYFNYYLNKVEQSKLFASSNFLEFQLDKLKLIENIFQTYNLKNYTDASFAISYLSKKLTIHLQEFLLLQISNQENNINKWNFLNIYQLTDKKDTIYYILDKQNKYYTFNEIPEENAKYYKKILSPQNYQKKNIYPF